MASDLYPGKVIGFDIWTRDNDDPTAWYDLSGGIFMSLSDSDMRSRAATPISSPMACCSVPERIHPSTTGTRAPPWSRPPGRASRRPSSS